MFKKPVTVTVEDFRAMTDEERQEFDKIVAKTLVVRATATLVGSMAAVYGAHKIVTKYMENTEE